MDMDINPPATDWRTQLQPDSRQRILNKIMDSMKKHLPYSGPEGLHEIEKVAERFEEKIYVAATSQSDYLRKISLKMLVMEVKSQNTMPSQALKVDKHAVDWRIQLQSDLRHQIVNIMIITLKKHQKFSGPEVLHELNTIAEKFEQEIYTAATSESEYVFLTWLKMNTIEIESQNRMPNQVGNSNQPPDQASLDSTNDGDWREEIYQKIKLMKENYLSELSEMDQKVATRLEQIINLIDIYRPSKPGTMPNQVGNSNPSPDQAESSTKRHKVSNSTSGPKSQILRSKDQVASCFLEAIDQISPREMDEMCHLEPHSRLSYVIENLSKAMIEMVALQHSLREEQDERMKKLKSKLEEMQEVTIKEEHS